MEIWVAPEVFQAIVLLLPCEIVEGVAVKVEIEGLPVTVTVTVTVVVLVTEPAALLAVSV